MKQLDLLIESSEIEQWGLSVRAVNVLRRNHIETAEQLIKAAENPEDLLRWANLGIKTLNELMSKAKELKLGEKKQPKRKTGLDGVTLNVYIANLPFMQAKEMLKIDTSLLSVRMRHSLEENQITDLLQVVGWSADDYAKLPQTGARTADDLYGKVSSEANVLYIAGSHERKTEGLIGLNICGGQHDARIGSEMQWSALLACKTINEWQALWDGLQAAEEAGAEADILFYDTLPDGYEDIAKEISKILTGLQICISPSIDKRVVERLTAMQIPPDVTIGDRRILDTFFENPLVAAAVDRLLTDWFKAPKCLCSMKELCSVMPESVCREEMISRAVERMTRNGQLLKEGDRYALPAQTVTEWAESIENERNRDMLLRKFQGETLESIGQSYDLTRERVRQIVAKIFGDVVLFEDRYIPLYTTYLMDEEEGTLLLGKTTFHYLELRYKHGDASLEEALEDETISIDLRRRIEQVLHRNYLHIDNRLILKRRAEIIDYIVRTCCTEQIEYDDFENFYWKFCKEHGLDGDKFALDSGSTRNRLGSKPNVLYAFHSRFRYYPMEQYDFSEFLETLNLEQYKNAVYSTLYFFREYPELMRQYDIRDEYELHNLLKKLIGYPNAYDIEFKKMPTIVFGKCNIDEQVLELLIELAPISVDELALAYEKQYGVKASVCTGTHFKCIAEYLEGRIYRIDTQALPTNTIATMKRVLTEDIYMMSELTKLYLANVPNAKKSDLSQYAIRSLGFKPYTNYVIRDSYKNAVDYFYHILTEREFIDLDELPQAVRYVHLYSSTLSELRKDYEIIEFAQRRHINIRRFKALNVTKEDFKQYCRDVFAYPMFKRYFSIHSLREAGFRHALDDLGFEDWFYSSLLQQDYDHFSVQRMGNVRVICKGRSQFSRRDVLADIVEQYGKIELDDLMDVLDQELGINLSTDDVVMLIDQSDMYYDRIMHTVYVDYETYFDDI